MWSIKVRPELNIGNDQLKLQLDKIQLDKIQLDKN